MIFILAHNCTENYQIVFSFPYFLKAFICLNRKFVGQNCMNYRPYALALMNLILLFRLIVSFQVKVNYLNINYLAKNLYKNPH